MSRFTRKTTPRIPTRQRAGQQGFALLLVFLMAAAVAFSLYRELPRVGFESARHREQLLMDRGNQFKRAIEVYYAVNKKYPATLDDLEKSSDKRFLRRRYKDPLTGNDEWRLIHTNGSFLTDSLVKKPPAQNAANGQPVNQMVGAGALGANNLNSVATGSGSNPVAGSQNDPNNPNGTGQPARNAAAFRRPSDVTGRPPGFDQNNNQDPNQQNQGLPGFNQTGFNPPGYNPNDPSTWPAITLAPAGQPQQGPLPGQPFGGLNGAFNGQNNQFNNNQFNNNQFNNPLNQLNGQAQAGLPGQNLPNQGNAAPVVIPGFGGQPQIAGQPIPVAQLGAGQDNSAGFPQQGIPGQLPGFGGANPQPNPLTPANPLDAQGNSPNQQAAALAQQQVLNQNQSALGAFQTAFSGQPAIQPNFNQQNQAGGNRQGFNPQALGQQGGVGFPGGPAQGQGGAAGGQRQGTTPLDNAASGIGASLFNPPGGGGLQGAGGNLGSPGIAGVASKFEGPSIMSYAERTKYQEWEFVFDPSTKTPGGQTQQTPQQNPGGLQNPNGQPNPGGLQNPGGAASPFGSPNPFGQPSSNGSPNPFGQPTPGQPVQQQPGGAQSPFQQMLGPTGR